MSEIMREEVEAVRRDATGGANMEPSVFWSPQLVRRMADSYLSMEQELRATHTALEKIRRGYVDQPVGTVSGWVWDVANEALAALDADKEQG